MGIRTDAEKFSKIIENVKPLKKISIGKFELKSSLGVKSAIQYNQTDLDLLNNKHEYTFPILEGDIELSLQLYKTVRNSYRLLCYTKIKNKQGMTFSINLSTEKESNNIIFLTQKIKFTERYEGSKELAESHRRQKQIVFCNLLSKLGLEVTDNNDLILGIFDPEKQELINTSPKQFLNDFIVVSILKGHFQGNKGYQLEILPSFNLAADTYTEKDTSIKALPEKSIKNKSKRHIPLALRFKILKRDESRCRACGRSPEDGIKLHIDHKKPFSLGGATVLSNLQTLCNECNLGKSNKYICD
jgi:hypothetical protein